MNETQLEDLAIEWLSEGGWQTELGPDVAPDSDHPLREDYASVLLEGPLRKAVRRINPDLPAKALDEVIHLLKTIDHPILPFRNRQFHRLLIDGVPVEVEKEDRRVTETVRLIDF